MPFEPAQRLQSLPPNLFAEIDRRARARPADGAELIDFGLGDPDLPTPERLVRCLQTAAADPRMHRYPPKRGLPRFNEAAARFMKRRYGLVVDPLREVLSLIGSKEGLGHLPLALINPGDVVLLPDPAYPVYRSATLLAGGRIVDLPLRAERGWTPDLAAIPTEVARAAKLLWINYPNNPIGAAAPHAFYADLVAFARQFDVIIAADAAYNEMYFRAPPPSMLEYARSARELVIEFHSCSKTFNMTGWRIGFAVGGADLIGALAQVKAHVDSGQFMPVQEVGAAAFDDYMEPGVIAARDTYGRRAVLLCEGLRELGWSVRDPEATLYVWAGLPGGQRDSLAAAARLLDEAALVTIPGVGFGPGGEGYLRFAVSVPEEGIRTALARLSKLRW